MKNMKTALRNKLTEAKGFTLTEMIVVLAIIGILIAIIAPNIVTLISGASETADAATAKNILTAAQSYTTDLFADGTYSYSDSDDIIPVGDGDDLSAAWSDGTNAGPAFDGDLLSTGTVSGTEIAYIFCEDTGIATGVVLVDGDEVLATSGTGTDGDGVSITTYKVGGTFDTTNGYAAP